MWLSYLIAYLTAPFRFVLDIVFPPSIMALQLRNMDADAFLAAIPKPFSVPSGGDQGLTCHILSRYKDPLVHEAIWQMKFRGDAHATHLLAEGLYRLIITGIGAANPEQAFLLIPVPASKKRIRTRGFDQCQRLAKCIGKIAIRKNVRLEITLDVLMKTKPTPEQKGQKRSDRLINLRDSFEINPTYKNMIQGRQIILVDDVLTTGATLQECTRVLLGAGAANVHAFALAH